MSLLVESKKGMPHLLSSQFEPCLYPSFSRKRKEHPDSEGESVCNGEVQAPAKGKIEIEAEPPIQLHNDDESQGEAEEEDGHDGSSFPQLPTECYIPSPTAKIQTQHDTAMIASQAEFRNASLCLSWAVTMGIYSGSHDVLFDMLNDVEGGLSLVMPFHLRLQAKETIAAAVDEVLGIHPTKSPRTRRMNNLLVLQCGHAGMNDISETYTLGDGQSYALAVTCSVDEQNGRLVTTAQFDDLVISSSLVQLMLQQFLFVYERILADPQSTLRTLHEANTHDRERIYRWNSGPVPEKSDKCVHDLITKQAHEHPCALAISAWDGDLTYQELEREANILARRLIKAGLQAEDLVCILTEKSKWAVIAMLGVLKGGGGFVLLDSALPTHRLVVICEKAGAGIVLVSKPLVQRAALLGPKPILVGEEGLDEEKEEDIQLPVVRASQVLYCTFTSGSTGEPKGVLIEHSAWSSGYDVFRQVSNMNQSSCVLQFASYVYVISVIEQLVTLLVGGCICIPSEEQLQNGLESAINKYRVNWAILTPSVARTVSPNQVTGIKTLLLVGEAITRSEMDIWQDAVELYSLYGQSEHPTAIMIARKSRATGYDQPNTLGFPACGRGWIVDPSDHNCLMPIGAEGELLVEGPALARGYISDEETRSTFITDPAWCRGTKNSRFLKTGDIVCYSPEHGALQFRGRKGGMVKIRGQRIELGEVEFHLRQNFDRGEHVLADLVHPVDNTQPILAAFVAPSETKGMVLGNQGLLAPVTPIFRDQVTHASTQMRRALPTCMIPRAFIAVQHLPRTSSGKLHRRALREAASTLRRRELLSYSATPTTSSAQAQMTQKETMLQSACSQLLNIPLADISMENNFFDLGGDSLLARQLVTCARERGLSLSVADCFQQSTLAMLAARARHNNQQTLDVIMDNGQFASLRTAFLKDLPSSLDEEQIQDVLPARESQFVFANDKVLDYLFIHISGAVDQIQLHQTCQRLVDERSTLRTIFLPFKSPAPWLQVVLREAAVRFDVIAVPEHHEIGHFAKSVCLDDRAIPRSMAQVAVKFILFKGHNKEHVLAVRISHALYDGLSLKPILEGLGKLYASSASGPRHADYAAYTRKCSQLYTDKSISFWKTFLAGSPLPQTLTDSKIDLDPRTKEELILTTREIPLPTLPKKTATGAGLTMATLIKAAWSYVLATETKSTDVVFGQMINCRSVDLPGTENIIGPCLNVSPVRVQYQPSKWRVRDLLRHVQDQHAQVVEHETNQWGDIVRDCTTWPLGTEVGSVVLHENFNQFPYAKVGESVWRMGIPIFSDPPERMIYVTTTPEKRDGRDILSVMLGISNWVMRKEDAERLVERLCGVLELFSRDYDAVVVI